MGSLTVDGYQGEISPMDELKLKYEHFFLISTIVLWRLVCGQKQVINVAIF